MDIDAESLKIIGENIRRERVRMKLSQERLSELAQMDITNLQRIESGRYNTKILSFLRIKTALNVSWETLIPNDLLDTE